MVEPNKSLHQVADDFKTWITQRGIPFAVQHSIDPEGGVFEAVGFDAAPDRMSQRRMRVQARQAYVFAHADTLGWMTDGQRYSDHAMAYLVSRAGGAEPRDGFAHVLGPNGDVADPRRDAYDHAFVILASTWRHAAFGDAKDLERATRVLDFFENTLRADTGGFNEGDPATLPRRQNPHMHLFEAMLAMNQYRTEATDRALLGKLFGLFENHFWDAEHQVLREFFTEDWRPSPDTGDVIEPGHLAEWCWLLDEYERLTGVDCATYITTLLDQAERLGLDPNSGFLIDSCRLGEDGPISGSRRLWVQTEYLRALCVAARRGAPGAAEKAAVLTQRIFEEYLNTPIAGGYYDQFDGDGELISASIPTSTLYHLFGAAVELDRTARELPR